MEKEIQNWEREFIEKGADLEHQRWSRWQAYLFSKSEWTKNGYLVPKELCERWQRQIDTPYSKLSEEEKESDREEVRKYLPLIRQLLQSEKQKLLEELREKIRGIKKCQIPASKNWIREDRVLRIFNQAIDEILDLLK